MIVLYIIIFLLLSAFFSGSEIAYVSANKLGIELKKEKGLRKGKLMSSFYEKPESFIGTLLVGNNLALVAYALFMEVLMKPVVDGIAGELVGGILITIVSTIVVLIFGEFLPKTIFRIYANNALYFFTYPLQFFKILLYPITWITNKFSTFIIKIFTREPLEKGAHTLTRFDLEHYISDGITGSRKSIETDIFKNALHLNKTRVKEVMVPRTEISYIDFRSDIDELIELFDATKHSRIVVIDEDIDDILGYVHHQQLLSMPLSIKKIILELPVVPETLNIQDLMLKLIKENTNMAWVVDEFGGTSGIVTLEDILEEIFGEIEDEHDAEDYIEQQISENEYLFSGRLEIDYLNEKYKNIKFPADDYTTLSGYLVMTTASIPTEGNEIVLDNYKFVFESVSEKKIETVRVVKLADEE